MFVITAAFSERTHFTSVAAVAVLGLLCCRRGGAVAQRCGRRCGGLACDCTALPAFVACKKFSSIAQSICADSFVGAAVFAFVSVVWR